MSRAQTVRTRDEDPLKRASTPDRGHPARPERHIAVDSIDTKIIYDKI